MGSLFAIRSMRHARFLCMASVALTLASPVNAASYMVGTWFGHGQPNDKDSMYIDHMRPNGSWRGEYRTCIKGNALDMVQEGHWSLKGDLLSLRVDTLNGTSAPRTDLYKMLAHTATTQKYFSAQFNFPYTPQREPDDFRMPSCHAGPTQAMTVSAKVGPLIKETMALIAAKNYKAATAKLNEAEAVKSNVVDDETVIKKLRIVIAEASDPTHHHCKSVRLGSTTCDGRQTPGVQP